MTQIKKAMDRFYGLTIEDVQDRRSWDIPTINRHDQLPVIFTLLRTNDHVWVVEDRESLILRGVITEKDVIKCLQPPELRTYSYGRFAQKTFYHCRDIDAGYLMNTKLITCSPADEVRDVIIKMIKYHVRRIPVVEKRALTGEVTIKTLIQKLLEMLTENGFEVGDVDG